MLTSKLELKPKLEEKKEWSKHSLFPLINMVSKVVKSSNPFELFAMFMVSLTGLGELFKRSFSWFWYIILIIVLGMVFYNRIRGSLKEEVDK